MDDQDTTWANGTTANPLAAGGLPSQGQIPALSVFFYLLGALELLSGIILFFKLLPSDPEPGYVWLFPKYLPAITWLITGVVSGSFTVAVAEVLRYLKGIYENTKSVQKAQSPLRLARQERVPIDEPSLKNEAADSCIAVLTSFGYKVTSPKRDNWVVELASGSGRFYFHSVEELQDFTTRTVQARSGKDLP